MQYTLRNVPALLDRMLRRRARERGTSLNEAVIEALARGAGMAEERVVQRNLRELAGAWKTDTAFDKAIGDQDVVEERLWR